MPDDCILVPLTRGKFAVIDAEDADIILAHKWFADQDGYKWYAVRTSRQGGTQTRVAMHRVILDTPPGFHTDHIDGDGLNNRRSNLRIATPSQNVVNSGLRTTNRSGFIGVHWNRNSRKWLAGVRVEGKIVHCGGYSDPEEAARARDAAARHAYGEFARLNFPD
jgi:hypothetical protein